MTFTLNDLEARVHERAAASADVSYTRKLLDRGVAHCAKKLGEEAVEIALAAVTEDREHLIAETADLLYHLFVVLEARGIKLAEVEAVLGERTAYSGPRREGGTQGRLARQHDPEKWNRFSDKIMRQGKLMDKRTDDGFSPYLTLSRGEWAALREDTPMTLTADEVTRVRSLHDRLDMKEIEEIYLPISRLLSLYVAATQRLFIVQQHFLGTAEAKVPYIIGVAGSVAVGKSTTARVLQALLARWPNTPKVDLVTTDGFLLPNAILEREGLMEKKGFPESYDLPALLRFLADVKAGRRPVRAPIYSHLVYDVVPNQWVEVDRPDILIVEGLNVLQAGHLPKDGKAIPYVSDFFDFSVYIDAEEDVLRKWYVDRFLTLRETAFRDPKSYFHRYSSLNDKQARETATSIWERINLINLRENIVPTRQRAHLILKKEASHLVQEVALRKL